MKLNEKLLTNTSKIILLLFAIHMIYQISRTSLGWAILTGSFLFFVACWLNHEPEQHKKRMERDLRIARESRTQNELINRNGGER